MSRLLIMLGAALVFAAFIDSRDQMALRRWNGRKEIRVTLLLGIALALFCGMRVWGNDTVTYLQIYDQLPPIHQWGNWELPPLAEGPGFTLLASLVKALGFTSQDYLLFFAMITVIPYVLFVHRFSVSMKMGIFLMFATGMYTFTLAAIKQCLATGICLIALSAALDGKWLRYVGMILFSTLFHPYSVVYLLVPLMMFKPWTVRTLLYVVLALGAGFYLDSLLGTVLDITTMMGAVYTEESFMGEGINVFRVAVAAVPMLLAAVYGKSLFRDTTREENLMFNLAMLNSLIMFVGLFGTANYFARLANYFLPAQVVVLPWLLNRTSSVDRAWLKPACILGYTGYFYYEYGILHPFDGEYSQISLWSYLEDLLGRIL